MENIEAVLGQESAAGRIQESGKKPALEKKGRRDKERKCGSIVRKERRCSRTGIKLGKSRAGGGGEVYPCPRRGGASRCLGSKNCLMCQGSIWEVLWDEYIDPNQGWIVSSTSVWHPYYNVLGADSKDVSSFLMTVETEAT